MLFRFWVFPDCTFLDISIVILRDIGDTVGTLFERQTADIHAAQLDRTVLHIPKGGDETGDGGLSAAGRADKGAGNAQKRRKDAQGIFAVPPFRQLHQPRDGGTLCS